MRVFSFVQIVRNYLGLIHMRRIYDNFEQLAEYSECPVCHDDLKISASTQGTSWNFSNDKFIHSKKIDVSPITYNALIHEIDTRTLKYKVRAKYFDITDKGKRINIRKLESFLNNFIMFKFVCSGHYAIQFTVHLNMKEKTVKNIILYNESLDVYIDKVKHLVINNFADEHSIMIYGGKNCKIPCLIFNGKDAHKLIRNIELLA